MVYELNSTRVIGIVYEPPWELAICQKCGRRGAHVPQGLYDQRWHEDRIVHRVRWLPSGIWQEVDSHPTALADERLLMELLLTPTGGQ